MAELTNRTSICSVLYLHIVEFSQHQIVEQMWLKERLNAALTDALAGVGADDHIILDTGSGAALGFLWEPENALFTGLGVRDALATQVTAGGLRPRIRIGINVGPVGMIKDINGKPTIVGDGVKSAQQIMLFAEPGQILVSRSYRDVLVRLSDTHADLFHYEGAKTDESGREYWVYAVSAAAGGGFRDRVAKEHQAYLSLGVRRKWTGAIAAWVRNLLR